MKQTLVSPGHVETRISNVLDPDQTETRAQRTTQLRSKERTHATDRKNGVFPEHRLQGVRKYNENQDQLCFIGPSEGDEIDESPNLIKYSLDYSRAEALKGPSY